MTRRLHVAFTPEEVDRPADTAIVIDLLRASTTIVTMVERGCAPIYVATTVAAAREAAKRYPDLILAGEEAGIAPRGFHLGNSPVEASLASLQGRPAVIVTTNGAPAIHAAAGSRVVLVGCLRNASAVSREAWAATAVGGSITIVCAGRTENPGNFGIDDAYCAGILIRGLERMGEVTLSDAAEAARLLSLAESDTLGLLRRSAAGRNVARLGLASDIDYAAEIDRSTTVPRVGSDLFLLDDTAGILRAKTVEHS